ncbi:MAG: putative ABC transport system ATP-binding protein [Lysobacterales bacterium]|jgi:putative ABC transport system ATP-binding protein
MSKTNALVHCTKVCKDYVMGENVVHALIDVDLEIQKGEYVAVMGPSGSGKSTLMNLIGALDTPTSGSLEVNGHLLQSLDTDGLAHFRNHTVGFVFQQFNLMARTTALENVKLPLLYSNLDRSELDDRAAECLALVGLSDRLDHQPSQLSGGQQQRVAIARALVNQPNLILADEPTGALDTATSEEIMALFKDLNAKGMTIIVVTHETEVAERARRNLLFRDGRVVDDVMTQPATAV